ncbi:MAG TPA: flagellar hook-length control protein FliK [Phenylobacterium sp.]|nr:flagellar hook-length control protein FliK [Phenylobacterium sp.]
MAQQAPPFETRNPHAMTAGFTIAAQTAQPSAGTAASGALQGAGLFGKTAATGPMAGFEALLAALFAGQGGADAQALKTLTAGGATPDALKAALGQAQGQVSSLLMGQDAKSAETDLIADGEPATLQDAPADPALAALVALLAAQTQLQANPEATTVQDGVTPDEAVLADAGKGAPKAFATDLAALDDLAPTADDAAEAAQDAQVFAPSTAATDLKAADIANRAARTPVSPETATKPAPAPVKIEAAPVQAEIEPIAAPTDEDAPPPALAAEASALAAPAPAPERPAAKPSRAEAARKDAAPTGPRAALAQAPAATEAAQPAVAVTSATTAPTAEGQAGTVEAAAPKDDAPLKADAPDTLAQPAGAAAAQAEQTHASSAAATPVRGSPETVAALAAQIVKKLEGRSTRFDVELNPADLGRVDVRIEIGAHGRMTATMSFENPQAAAELRSRADELQKSLEQAGFDIAGGLQFDVANDQRQASQGQPDQSAGANGGQARGRAFQAALDTADDSASAALTSALAYRSRPATGVDIRI